MKTLFAFMLLIQIGASAQAELYDMAFGRTENFRILTAFGGSVPDHFRVLDSTAVWRPDNFHLENTDLTEPTVLAALEREEHHPFHHAYLFSDKSLSEKVSSKEKIKLAEKAKRIKPMPVKLTGSTFSPATDTSKSGFYFRISEPIFTADGKLAFVNILIFRTSDANKSPALDYYGSVKVSFEKTGNHWKQIGLHEHLFL